MIASPRNIKLREAAIVALAAGNIAAITGARKAANSSKNFKKITPKIAPVILPIPPTIIIPRYHMEFISTKWSGCITVR